jgi:hypothetical protein
MNITQKQFDELNNLVLFDTGLIGNKLTEEQLDIVRHNPYATYWYAKNVIQGPWEEGERAIKMDARASYYYALVVIRKPWQPGEYTINNSFSYRIRYQRWCKRFTL